MNHLIKRPNILLIHADQHRWDCLGVNGHRLLQTPHLDLLAAMGINFTHAFTPNPVCSPARACLQTGAWATTHKCVTIPGTEAFQNADSRLPTLTGLLADSGYRIAHIGKFHQEVTGTPTDHGAEIFIGGYQYHRWRESQGLPPQPRQNGWFGETDPFITPEQSPLAWQADQVIAQLHRFSGGNSPFFLRWDPTEPHLPNIVPEPYASLYPREQIYPWPSFPDPLENKPDAQRRTRQRWGVEGYTWEDWQPIVQRYLGEITLLDLQIGRIREALRVASLEDNTLFIYTCDHGDMCGGHGMLDKHFVMYEDNMRVPLLVSWPGILPQGQVCDAFTSQELDVAKTILTAAGVAAPPSFIGRDLIEEALGTLPDPRPDIFAQYQGTHQGLYSQRMLRDRRWRYVYNPVSRDELYDLETDPGELINRVQDPTCAEQLHQMRERMSDWMRQISDPLSPPLFTWR